MKLVGKEGKDCGSYFAFAKVNLTSFIPKNKPTATKKEYYTHE